MRVTEKKATKRKDKRHGELMKEWKKAQKEDNKDEMTRLLKELDPYYDSVTWDFI